MKKFTFPYYMLLLVLLCFLFFTNDFGIVDIQKTAIVLGVGLDKEEDGFTLTTQLAVPQASDSEQQTDSVEVSGFGKTVAEAFTKINAKTGWYPKLIFCNLVLLGESFQTEDCSDAVGYFLRNENVNDNAQIAACEGTAKEFLSTKSPTNDMSSIAVRKVLSDESKLSGKVLPLTLREFAIGYYNDASAVWLPLLRKIPKGPSAVQPNADQAQGTQTEYVFDASQTLLLKRGKGVQKLNEEQTFLAGLLQNDIRLADLTVEHEGILYTLGLRNGKKKFEPNPKDGTFRVVYSCLAQKIDADVAESITQIAQTDAVKKDVLLAGERKLQKLTEEVFALCQESNCDLFGMQAEFAKFHPNYAKEHPALLQEATVIAEIHMGKIG